MTAIDTATESITLDELRTELAKTEPLSEVPFDMSTGAVRIRLKDGFADNIENDSDDTPLEAELRIGSNRTFQLTRSAFLEASSLMGLNQGFAKKTPARLLEPLFNYWFQNTDKKNKILVKDSTLALAMSPETITPFSNLRLVDVAEEAFKAQYGPSIEVMADYKSAHDLRTTRARLYVPASQRAISLGNGEDHMHAAGIQIANSLRGSTPLSLNGYLFNYWCTNGQISTVLSSGSYRRRQGQGAEVYEWARAAVDDILGGMEHEFEQLQALTSQRVGDDTAQTIADVFDTYKVPLAVRPAIMETLINEEDLTAYKILQAITATANNPDLPEGTREKVMTIGGDLPHAFSERCDSCHRIQIH